MWLKERSLCRLKCSHHNHSQLCVFFFSTSLSNCAAAGSAVALHWYSQCRTTGCKQFGCTSNQKSRLIQLNFFSLVTLVHLNFWPWFAYRQNAHADNTISAISFTCHFLLCLWSNTAVTISRMPKLRPLQTHTSPCSIQILTSDQHYCIAVRHIWVHVNYAPQHRSVIPQI